MDYLDALKSVSPMWRHTMRVANMRRELKAQEEQPPRLAMMSGEEFQKWTPGDFARWMGA